MRESNWKDCLVNKSAKTITPDRGVQYASQVYIDRLKELGIAISMSGKGNAYDNAFAESFIKTLKVGMCT